MAQAEEPLILDLVSLLSLAKQHRENGEPRDQCINVFLYISSAMGLLYMTLMTLIVTDTNDTNLSLNVGPLEDIQLHCALLLSDAKAVSRPARSC